jgi:hypothetical protein
MRPHHQPTTIAILGADTLVEDILAWLLQDEGYNTRLLEAYPEGVVDELLDGVDLLLLVTGLSPDVHGTFLDITSSIPRAARMPVLTPSPTLKEALLDELATSVPWRSPFDALVQEIHDALVAASAVTLPVDEGEAT